MILDGINYPNKIVDAIKDNKLVVFVGAGVSKYEPTCLPEFVELVETISKGTSYNYKKCDKSEECDKYDESCEVFLGRLKSKGIPIHEHAKEIFDNPDLNPNELHKSILNLFSNPEKIRIVTTNCDLMLEETEGFDSNIIKVFSAPTLPMGDEFSGIVHIHGSVKEPQHMVLTDADFGRAYMTEGYASRFIKKVFSNYTVLFVGYSYNDVVLRYLTRAMHRDNDLDFYILTEEKHKDKEWEILGLEPIVFPDNKYKIMQNSLVKLGDRAKRELVDWKSVLSEISEEPPQDRSFETEIEYCLENYDREKIVAKCVQGNKWLEYLDGKDVFKECFLKESDESKKIEVWGKWLCDKFIGIDDDAFQLLIIKHNNTLNDMFVECIINRLVYLSGDIDDVEFGKYVLFIEPFIRNKWDLLRLIDDANERKMSHLCFVLFKRLFDIRFLFKSKMVFRLDASELNHIFLTDSHHINLIWEKYKEIILEKNAYQLVGYLKSIIEHVEFSYATVNKTANGSKLFAFLMLDIENKDKHSKDNPLVVISMIIDEACSIIQNQNVSFFKCYLNQCLNSKSSLMQRIALKILRESDHYEVEEKYKIITKDFSIDSVDKKEQLFLLVANIWPKLSIQEKDAFIDHIVESYKTEEDDRDRKYEFYNWCVWLQKHDSESERLKVVVREYEEDEGFLPREFPELNIYSSSSLLRPVDIPDEENKMKQLTSEELIERIVNYHGKESSIYTKREMQHALALSLQNNYDLTKKIINKLVKNDEKDASVWDYILRSINDSDYSVEELISIVVLLSDNIRLIEHVTQLSSIILRVMRDKKIGACFAEYESDILKSAKIIWKNRKKDEFEDESLDFRILNTTAGNIINSWVYMVSNYEEKIIPKEYKELFDEALSLSGKEVYISICIIVGYFNFFYFRDKEWSINKLLSYLRPLDEERFNAAWTGVVIYSGTINRNTADILEPYYYEAIDKIQWLTTEMRKYFIAQIVTLITFVVDEPLEKFIPKFYKNADEEDIIDFIDEIEKRIVDYDIEDRRILWEAWLRDFLKNRKENKPTPLSEIENQELYILLPHMNKYYEEAVSIICKEKVPKRIDDFSWFLMNKNEMGIRYPESTLDLLVFLLSGDFDIGCSGEDISNLAKSIKTESEDKKKQLNNLLLKHDIDAEI